MDIRRVGATISKARKDKGMTQMALADAMYVSYQAVSSWERGLTMPDIQNLPKLGQLLGISIDDLLGRPVNPVIQNTLSEEGKVAFEVEDIKEAAPILRVDQVDEALEDLDKQMTFEDVLSLAPFVSSQVLDEIIDKYQVMCEYSKIVALAPFMSQMRLNAIFEQGLSGQVDQVVIVGLAPFVSSKDLHDLVKSWIDEGHDFLDESHIISLAPFLDQASLDLLLQSRGEVDLAMLVALAPFLSQDRLNDFIQQAQEEEADDGIIVSIGPFLSGETLKGLVSQYMDTEDRHIAHGLLAYLDQRSLGEMADKAYNREGIDGLIPYAPFLSKDQLDIYLELGLKANGISAIRPLLPFADMRSLDDYIKKLLN